MTSKKKAEEVAQENAKVMKEAFDRGAQLPVEKNICGHINKQFMNSHGKREDLACTLPKGHDSDHFATFTRLVTDYGMLSDAKGNSYLGPTGSHQEIAEGWWSDAAGEYPKAVVVTPEEDFQRLKEARARERSKDGVEVDSGLIKKLDDEVKGAYGGG